MKNSCRFLSVRGAANFTAIFLLIIFAGCATKYAASNLSEEEVLRERLMAYWGHMINKEYDKAFEYEYNLDKLTKEKYAANFSGAPFEHVRVDAQSVSISINKEDGTADTDIRVFLKFRIPGFKGLEHPMNFRERWVRVKEVWYHVK